MNRRIEIREGEKAPGRRLDTAATRVYQGPPAQASNRPRNPPQYRRPPLIRQAIQTTCRRCGHPRGTAGVATRSRILRSAYFKRCGLVKLVYGPHKIWAPDPSGLQIRIWRGKSQIFANSPLTTCLGTRARGPTTFFEHSEGWAVAILVRGCECAGPRGPRPINPPVTLQLDARQRERGGTLICAGEETTNASWLSRDWAFPGLFARDLSEERKGGFGGSE